VRTNAPSRSISFEARAALQTGALEVAARSAPVKPRANRTRPVALLSSGGGNSRAGRPRRRAESPTCALRSWTCAQFSLRSARGPAGARCVRRLSGTSPRPGASGRVRGKHRGTQCPGLRCRRAVTRGGQNRAPAVTFHWAARVCSWSRVESYLGPPTLPRTGASRTGSSPPRSP
jgi:hypothetical protein